MKIWLNGEIRDASGAIDANDRGFLLGDGIFETLLVRKGKACFLAQHIERLNSGLTALKFGACADMEKISGAISQLCSVNELTEADAAIRITVTRGPGERGLGFPSPEKSSPTWAISARPFLWAESQIAAVTIASTKRFSGAVGARFKTGNYLDSALAKNEALDAGFDDAVMLNEHERPVCFSAANLFCFMDDKALVTPPVSEGALPGIVRGLLLEYASTLGLTIHERPVSMDDIENRFLLMTNSLIGVQGASVVRNRPAPLALQEIQSWYDSLMSSTEATRGGF